MVTETMVSVIAFNRRKSVREYSTLFDEFCYKAERNEVIVKKACAVKRRLF